jgi:hypothetical protein
MDFEKNIFDYYDGIEFITPGLIKPSKGVGYIFLFTFVLLMKYFNVLGHLSFIKQVATQNYVSSFTTKYNYDFHCR